MKVSYRKSFDDNGYVNSQTIKIENGDELFIISDLLMDLEKEFDGSYSLSLSVIRKIKDIFNNKRILIKNTKLILDINK